MVITIEVFEFPPRESYRRRVNLESLNGTNPVLSFDNSWMHLPNVEREEFMCFVSFSLSPDTNDFFTLSDPAKSTRYSVEITIALLKVSV